MFVACGEITNTLLKENTLILQTDKKYLADLINEDANILVIKRAIRFLGYNFDVSIELLESRSQKSNKDIDFLKDKLGEFLVVE